MPELEAVGKADPGDMESREPQADEADGRTHESRCLNCSCALAGPYCHCCGQRAHVHRTIGAWWHDFLHSVLHLDGKFWRTIPMLAWRPGELTRRYAHGERARFISPLALFLFSVFLMFAVVSLSGGGAAVSDPDAPERIAAELAETERNIAQLEQRRDQAVAQGQSTTSLDERIERLRSNREVLAGGNAAMSGRPIIDTDIRTGWARLDEGIAKAGRNPALLFYKLQANAYKFSWALIPISVPFVWILFLHRARYRREFTAYDHLVFVTYSIAFMSLALIVFISLSGLGVREGVVSVAFILVPMVHLYRHLRGAYQLRPLSALWRTVVLLIFANLALTVFILLLLAIGVLG
jgi:hypothetical protein